MNTSFNRAGILILCTALASCHNNTTSTSSTTDSTASMGNSAVTTTHTYTGTFQPQANMKYMDLKTHNQVGVRIDTSTGTLVNSETNEPMDLFVSGTDTIYGQTGVTANNYITHDENGNYSVDQARMSGSSDMSNAGNIDNSATSGDNTGTATADNSTTPRREKYKEKNGNTKLKTDDEKIKDKDGVEKVKDR